MKIAIVCANGHEGSLIAKEAVNRGHEVTAIVRGENKSAAQNAVIKSVEEITASDLSGFDAVVDAFGAWTPETIPGIGDTIIKLADEMKGNEARLLVVGGAGSLFVNPEHTVTVDMGPEFPDDWKPLSASHGRGLQYLRNSEGVKWTYISPACDFQAEGEPTEYKLGGEELILSDDGKSEINYATYAVAMLDEIEKGNHVCERISVVRK